jgi:hypothetical protein
MGVEAIAELADKRRALKADKANVDTRVTGLTTRQTALAASITDIEGGITGAGGAIPANTAVPTVTGTAKVGSTLTGVDGTFTGTPTPTKTREWLIGGVVKSTAQTYVPVTADIGKTAVFRVTASNVIDKVTASSVATSAIIA